MLPARAEAVKNTKSAAVHRFESKQRVHFPQFAAGGSSMGFTRGEKIDYTEEAKESDWIVKAFIFCRYRDLIHERA